MGILSQLAIKELTNRYVAENDILSWGKLLFPEKFNLPFCEELHNYFVSIRDSQFTNTEAPRGHAKSAIKCFLIPIYQALNEPEKFKHYLNVQATFTKSVSVNKSIKEELEKNENLIFCYGNQIGLSRWSDNQFVLKNGVVFTAIGAGNSIRGINYNNIRPDYIIVDDLYDEEDIHNPEGTEKKNSWFWGSLYQARAKSKYSCIHIQGTAINEYDLMYKLKADERFLSKTFKAIKNDQTKEVLWKELNTYDTLMYEQKSMGTHIFMREMQNERKDDKTSYIKASWIKYFDLKDLNFDKHFVLHEVVVGVDPSIGEKSENDYTGISLILKTKYSDSNAFDYYIVNVWNEQISLDSRVKLLQNIYDSYSFNNKKINKCRIEAIAGFKDFVAEVKRRTTVPVNEVTRVKDKIANLEYASKFFQNGKVFINNSIDFQLKNELIYQLTTNHPKHDDLRDSVFLALEEATNIWTFARRTKNI